MRKNCIKTVSFALILTLLTPFQLPADPIYKGQPPVNAFSAGIGFSGVGLVGDPSVLYWNPAGLSAIDQLSVDFTVAAPVVESPGSWSFLIANSSSGEGGRFGMILMRQHILTDDMTYKVFQFNTPLSYGFSTGQLPVGVTLKFISESLEEDNWHYGVSFDLGMQWITNSGLILGIASLNIAGSDLQAFENESWFGISWGKSTDRIMLTSQFRIDDPFSPTGISDNYKFGLSVKLYESLPAIRSGFSRTSDGKRITVGISYQREKQNTHIEYSLSTDPGDWENRAHFLTYGYAVGSSYSKPSVRRGW